MKKKLIEQRKIIENIKLSILNEYLMLHIDISNVLINIIVEFCLFEYQ